MREIKFKAKRLDNGEWCEGYFYEENGNTYIIENRQKESMLNRNVTYEVDPSSVCQFTGLKTKEGTPIYEGDILSNFPFLKGEVSLYKGCFIVLRSDDSYVPLFEYINNVEPDVVNLKHKGSKFDRKEGEK